MIVEHHLAPTEPAPGKHLHSYGVFVAAAVDLLLWLAIGGLFYLFWGLAS